MIYQDNYWGQDILAMLEERKYKLQELISSKAEELNEAPKGVIRIQKSNGVDQYYIRENPQDKNGKYIPKSQKNLARRIIQRDYDKKVYDAADAELTQLKHYIYRLEKSGITKVYDNFTPKRQKFITPIMKTDMQLIESWKAVKYEGLSFSEDNTEFISNNGVRVRSKAELLISNLIEQKGVLYHYEFPLNLKGFGTVHPDFYCLNLRRRRVIIWEHFGMMDNPDYANSTIAKINAYEKNGYKLGDNFIATFESARFPLSSVMIKCKIEEYLV